MVWTCLGLFLVAYLPGALIFRIPVADRTRRASLAVEERLFWAVVLSVAWSSLVAMGLAAAERYRVDYLLLANAGISAVVCLVWRRGLSYRGLAARPGWGALLPLVPLVFGLLLFSSPAEYVIGGKDPGVYVNEGIAIAQRGSLLVHDEVAAAVPPASRDLFFPQYRGQPYYSLRFMGFWLLDPDAGTVVGQFPHLFPVWVAIGYGLDGLTGARQAIGWWSVLGLLAVYFAGARLIGRPAAAVAVSLLGFSQVEIWFGRYPNSEMPMQALVFAALLAFNRAHVDGDRFFGWVAGLLLGLMLFLRIDAALAVVAVAIAAILLLTQRKLPRVSFVVSLGITLAAAAVYLAGPMKAYAARPLGFLVNLQLGQLTLLAAGAFALAFVLIASRRARVAQAVRDWVPRGLAVLIACAAIYAYFLRQPGGRLAAHDAASFRMFAWYLPPEALAIAVAGAALLIWRRFWLDTALFVTMAAFAFFFFYKVQIVPQHFWMARRFVAVLYPSALLMMAGAALYWSAPRRRAGADGLRRHHTTVGFALRVGLPAVFLAFVGWRLVTASRPILRHVEYAGVIPKLEELASRFGDEDLVLVEPRWSSDMHVLALPLAYVYSRNVLVLNTPRPDKARFREFLTWAKTRYRTVFFLGGGGVDLLSRSISAEPVVGDRFQIPEYESRVDALPARVRFKEFDYSVYRLEPSAAAVPFRAVDVGAADDLTVWRFHAKQRQGEVTYRWSRDASYVGLPGLAPTARTVTIWMSNGGRPPALAPARVAVSLNDEPLGEVTVPQGFRPYPFDIPPGLSARIGTSDEPAVLKLTCLTWNPRTALGRNDDRDLGVMVDRVEVQ